MAFTIKVNGSAHQVDVDGDTPLLWVLRDAIGLTGTKYGCGVAQCGACTVLLNGKPLRSCTLPVSALGTAEVTTIEGVTGRTARAVQGAWQGKTLTEICEQIKDPARNGGKDMAQLVQHMGEDSLVGWGWAPGAGRAPVPGTQKQFGALARAWADAGAHCPPTQ